MQILTTKWNLQNAKHTINCSNPFHIGCRQHKKMCWTVTGLAWISSHILLHVPDNKCETDLQEKRGKVYLVVVWRKRKVWSYPSWPVLWMKFKVFSSIFLFTSLESSLLPYNKYWTRTLFGRVSIWTNGRNNSETLLGALGFKRASFFWLTHKLNAIDDTMLSRLLEIPPFLWPLFQTTRKGKLTFLFKWSGTQATFFEIFLGVLRKRTRSLSNLPFVCSYCIGPKELTKRQPFFIDMHSALVLSVLSKALPVHLFRLCDPSPEDLWPVIFVP